MTELSKQSENTRVLIIKTFHLGTMRVHNMCETNLTHYTIPGPLLRGSRSLKAVLQSGAEI